MQSPQVIDSLPRLISFWRASPRLRLSVYLAGLALCIIAIYADRPPTLFAEKTLVTVTKNSTINAVAHELAMEHIITSPLAFNILVHIFNPKHGVLSGTYYFSQPVDALTVAYRLSQGKFGLAPLKLTIPEGSNVFQIEKLLERALPNFDGASFVEHAKPEEGYLFPDTYRFSPTETPDEIIATMKENFEQKIASIHDEIAAFGKPVRDVIIMASYLEEEARLMQTRRMVAGILWKRLKLGMPLQIDAAFQYVNGKSTPELTLDDLKIDSPYNTYLYKGFTPGPISNPGLDSIMAAITPIQSRYFYFLTDKEGNMHYAVTLDEHIANKAQYLK